MLRTFVVFVCLMVAVIWLETAVESLTLVDLGVARFPPGAGERGASAAARLTVHDWQASRNASHYRLAYAHGNAAAGRLEADHLRLAELFSLRMIDDDSFLWRPPPKCVGREWECIYTTVLARSAIDLDPVLERIEEGFLAGRWTTADAARWLLAFVQQIPYRLPHDQPFGVLPPALVAAWDWGDCDSKSLLLIHLLRRIGIDSVLLVSAAQKHALVGIAVPSGGSGFAHRGREYAWAETTAENAPLGWMHPTWQASSDWKVVPID